MITSKTKLILMVDYDNISKKIVEEFKEYFRDHYQEDYYKIIKFACKHCGRYNEADVKINSSLKDATDVKMIIYATRHQKTIIDNHISCFILTKDHFASALSLFLDSCYHVRNIKDFKQKSKHIFNVI